MNTHKPRLRYDSPNGVWLCDNYYGYTPTEAWSMWDYSERLKRQPIVFDKEAIEQIFKHMEEEEGEYRSTCNRAKDKPESSHIPQTDNIVDVRGLDRASPDQPEYASADLSILDNRSATKEDLRGFCSKVGLHYPDHLKIPVAVKYHLKKVIQEQDKWFEELRDDIPNLIEKVKDWRKGNE